ncbi:hypothetical protein [Streptosporangium sp. NPDC006007]|uniref:hypothetical protein n=1 Tax=Streptosporangium sp. NPDC006007 TaxID=3154575 RepID=UPI0033AFAE47
MLFCCVAPEFSFNLWAAKLAADQTGLSAVGAGPFPPGALADSFGTQQAFLMVPALIGPAVGGILISSRWRT